MLAIYVQIYFVARRHSTKISQIHATVVTKKKMENVMNDDIYDNIHNFDKINAENNDDDEFGNSFSLNGKVKKLNLKVFHCYIKIFVWNMEFFIPYRRCQNKSERNDHRHDVNLFYTLKFSLFK